jgi:hypothetical protein
MTEFRYQFAIRLIRYDIYFAQLRGHLLFLLGLCMRLYMNPNGLRAQRDANENSTESQPLIYFF